MTEEQVRQIKGERSKKQREDEKLQLQRVKAALAGESPFKIVIDCGFIQGKQASPTATSRGCVPTRSPLPLAGAVIREQSSLVKQIEQSMVVNKRSAKPVYLAATGFTGEAARIGENRNANKWPIKFFKEPAQELFTRESLVVLSPDADKPLEALEEGKARHRLLPCVPHIWRNGSLPPLRAAHPRMAEAPSRRDAMHLPRLSQVYVIGGIVDRTVKKHETKSFAEEANVECRRLPIQEVVGLRSESRGRHTHPKMNILNINEVVEALLAFHETGDWAQALDRQGRGRICPETFALVATFRGSTFAFRALPGRKKKLYEERKKKGSADDGNTSEAEDGDDSEGEDAEEASGDADQAPPPKVQRTSSD